MTSVAKSPLSDLVGDAQCGGFFPAEMKFAGFDAIVLHGKADSPVYLLVREGEAELRPADHLWSRSTGEVQADLIDELGDRKIEVAQCGPAGEKGVRFAAIMNMSNRANGRTGMGAVMGSKNLKAVVVRGKDRPALADRKALLELAKWGAENFEDSDVYGLGLFGTAEVTLPQNKDGGLPSYNWKSGFFEGAEALDGTTMARTILKERDTCYACTVRCKRVVEIEDGPYKVDPLYGGPEYETLATFGSYCGIDDLAAVSYANQLCNMYGMDTISCGATIAWAMECFENGILAASDADGLNLRFGEADAMVTMVEKIAKREGFGDLLAEGSARAAQLIGNGSEDLLLTVKNQELPAHMPQVKRSLGLIYAVNPFGADHESSEHDPSYADYPERMAELDLHDPQPDDVLNQEKVRFAMITQHAYSCLDSLNVCQFVFGPSWHLYSMSQLAKTVRAITGWEVEVQDLLTIGERRLNLLRAFNAREGVGAAADTLPRKLFKHLVGGPSDGVSLDKDELEQAKRWYYEYCGWDDQGVPTRGKLSELGLDWLADEIEV
jgi:aldehyde:ferredoxin oxidoreductase